MSTAYQIKDQEGLYYLTFQVIQWVDIFTRKIYRDIIIDNLKYCQEQKGLQVFAYVIMSNHVHLIVNSTEGNLSNIVRDFKKYTSRVIIETIQSTNESRREWMLNQFSFAAKKHSRNQNYQFWTHENHAIDLRTPDFIREKIEYIHNNPVRGAYLFGNTLNDGTKLGDPVPKPRIAPSGTDTLYGKFGCTREGNNCRYGDYNFLTFDGREKSHDGIDIYTSVGTPVHAIYGGKVVAVVADFDMQNVIYSQNSARDVQGNSSREDFISTTNTSNNYSYYSIILDEKVNDTTYFMYYKRGMNGCHYKSDSYGNYVIIESTDLKEPINTINGNKSDKVYILYGHLNSVNVSMNHKVNKGDVIGDSGCSGNAARIEKYRYHIHIEASSFNNFIGKVRDINPLTILKTKQ